MSDRPNAATRAMQALHARGSQLQRGEPVEVYALALSPNTWRWFDGYVFDAIETDTGCALVRVVGGTYEGCLVRYDTSRVRRAVKR